MEEEFPRPMEVFKCALCFFFFAWADRCIPPIVINIALGKENACIVRFGVSQYILFKNSHGE